MHIFCFQCKKEQRGVAIWFSARVLETVRMADESHGPAIVSRKSGSESMKLKSRGNGYRCPGVMLWLTGNAQYTRKVKYVCGLVGSVVTWTVRLPLPSNEVVLYVDQALVRLVEVRTIAAP